MNRKLAIHRNPSDPLRACVHDLRNLFAVVASAKSLFERELGEEKRRLVLDALGRVAVEGKIVTDALLAGERKNHAESSDAAAELRNLAPIISALEHPGRRIELSIGNPLSCIRMDPAEFRAIVLELVTNAAAAGASRIQIREAFHGGSCWIIVGDNGVGFADKQDAPAQAAPGLHGTGLRRLITAVAASGGTVKIRSKPGRGSTIALILPPLSIASPRQFRADSLARPEALATRLCTTEMEHAA